LGLLQNGSGKAFGEKIPEFTARNRGHFFENETLPGVFCNSPNFNIIVVDNASEDDSLSVLNKYLNNIQLIKNPTNVGFAAAHNQLIPQLDTDYLWLLNTDTIFDHEIDVFNPIIKYLDQHPNVSGLSPKLLNTDGTVQPQGGGLNQWVYHAKKTRKVSFLCGAALFIRTSFFIDIGGFDSRLFFYNDDFDFAKQSKRHNKQLIYFPSIQITHYGGGSSKCRPIDSQIAGYHGSIYLCHKFYSRPIFKLYYLVMRILIYLKTLYYTLHKDPTSAEWVTKLNKLKKQLNHEF
jgi:GT2 family glycosyltransferase